MGNVKKQKISLAGQTIIETLVALFILVMGVTAATGLAIFSFSASTAITKQIISTGLAREGIEAVKNMRDTNWLKQSPINTDCYNYSTGASNAKCYKQWLNYNPNGFNIGTSSPKVAFRLGIKAANAANEQIIWSDSKTDNGDWGLDFDDGSSMNLSSFLGFYNTGNNNDGITNGTSGFYRQILLTEDNSGNYSQDEFHRLIVESRVWWTDKKCPKSPNWPGLGKCSVSLITNLTNWKDYQLLQ